MFPIAPSISLLFIIFVLVMAILFVIAVQTAGKRLNESVEVTNKWTRNTVIVLIILFGTTGFLAVQGILLDFDRIPPPFGIVGIFSLILTIILSARSTWGARMANGLPFQILIGFQSFRIIVEFFLFQLYKTGIIPIQMTFEGRNWDIITGILVLVYLAVQMRVNIPRWAIITINLIGLALVTNIVIVAILSTPLPIRMFMNEPANTVVAYFPFIWLPVFLVQLAIGGHILTFRKLLTEKKQFQESM